MIFKIDENSSHPRKNIYNALCFFFLALNGHVKSNNLYLKLNN